MDTTYPNLTVLTNPLSRHYMTVLRDKSTGVEAFREATARLAAALVLQAAKHFPVEKIEVETPMEVTTGYRVAGQIVAVPVVRAGLGLLEGVIRQVPDLKVGYIGVARDEETALPHSYYTKLPDLAGAHVMILEPMLATGGSLSWAIDKVKEEGAEDITALCVCAAPEGVERLFADHPNIRVITAAVDRGLDENAYIQPGLGDMGDRLFGTF